MILTEDYNYNPNSPHVVFLSATGDLVYSAKSHNIHKGMTIIGEFPNMIEADEFVKNNSKFYEKK